MKTIEGVVAAPQARIAMRLSLWEPLSVVALPTLNLLRVNAAPV